MNQAANVLDGTQDAGTLQLAPPIATPLTAPTATVIAGTEMGVGLYTYAVTFVTGHKREDATLVVSGETPAGPWVNVTTTTGNGRVSLTNLPTSAATTVIGRRIYRTIVGGSGQRKLVATIAAGVTSYVDSTPDVNLGVNEPGVNTTGTKFSFPTPTASTEPATKGYADAKFVELGTTNQNVELVQSLLQAIDTRTVVLTRDANGRLATTDEKDGAVVVRSTALNYDATTGRLSTVVVTCGGKTITYTLNYNGDGSLGGVTPTVV